ncbi:thiol:disulfide interchange protein DsbA/DsbL [Kangiella sp. TOML190]|uniref:thiol:disulfide interchange protein DsbA/DsbL n=1 Tax=Kangiella sp. TOML190 TaxID=2931351 RepID=UPI00203C4906|nr:thiol:disulfide interchange protein DsbA/DsbL [Kangiella sp. TOML190]
MKLKTVFFAALSFVALTQLACAESPQAVASKYKEGKDYETIAGAKGISKPQVIEFFSYTCPHCYTMEGFVHKWVEGKPADVEFVQMPVYMSQVPHLTQGYYAAEVLGVLDKVHMVIFNQWHRDKQVIRTKRDLYPVFENAGVSSADFEKAYNSFAVANKVQHAKKMAKDLKVTSFPRFVVNQKYTVKNYDQLEKLLNELPLEKAK